MESAHCDRQSVLISKAKRSPTKQFDYIFQHQQLTDVGVPSKAAGLTYNGTLETIVFSTNTRRINITKNHSAKEKAHKEKAHKVKPHKRKYDRKMSISQFRDAPTLRF